MAKRWLFFSFTGNRYRRPRLVARCVFAWIIVCIGLTSCDHSPKPEHPIFEILDQSRTGIDFSNNLKPTPAFNVLKYMYYYNGGGVGAGDFNNDGKIDVFFASNEEQNKLYLNTGNLHFKDVTQAAKIPNDGGWSTGVSVVDINNDGLLDIYVCRVGNHETLHGHNLLLICQGIDKNGVPSYRDESKEYGLDFSGFSTQAVFFDYDGDGDLDMYLLNHSIHQNRTFGKRSEKLQSFSPVSGDHLYRNEGNNHFTDVTKASGINSSVIGYGLGIAVSDVNLDGYPDLYISNDFHENDYLYINRHNGTFSEQLNDHIMHTSQFSMGVDIADANNDGYPEIMTVDMLANDPYILKRSLGEDSWDIFFIKLGYGYNYQYTRNNLQYNRRNGMFSEVGLYSGVAATDWSWAPLWLDFDNDGLKDLFISNGIPKRLNDIDYSDFVFDKDVQDKLKSNDASVKDMELISKFPEIKIPNKVFRNVGNMQFADMEDSIANNMGTFSNGTVYADFDNDGDLDVLVNNLNAPALLYENKTGSPQNQDYADIHLMGSTQNKNAIGSKIILFANGGIRTYEKFPVRGFLSSMEMPVHIGLKKTKVDSAFLVWPDNTYEPISLRTGVDSFTYKQGLPVFDYSRLTGFWKNPTHPMEDITRDVKLLHRHEENSFHEFDREPLLPHMLSTEGPALAVADINHDGLDDVFIGGAKWKAGAVLIQDASGKFRQLPEPALNRDSVNEDVDACWIDVNHDGSPDLVVASGGNEFYGNDVHLSPRVYINDGKGNLAKLDQAFNNLFVNASSVVPIDFNGDGYTDLFIGGRSVPFNYGEKPRSYLLQNDGSGRFSDVTSKYCPGLVQPGFVTKAIGFDLNKDGQKDLLLTFEWGGIAAFMNNGSGFDRKQLTDKSGWWNFVLPVDIDGDGDIDLVAGNLGLNSRLKASDKEPVRLYFNDFDGNGKKEQLLTYYLGGREIPFPNKDELQRQLPMLKKKFIHASDFAKAPLSDLFPGDALKKADTLTANYFANAVLMNNGNMEFSVQQLPWQSQLSPYRDAVAVNANDDNLPDILLTGNYYDNNIQMGRYDADFGTILVNKGNGRFEAEAINGLQIRGQVRHIAPIQIGHKSAFILARNNDSTMVIDFKK